MPQARHKISYNMLCADSNLLQLSIVITVCIVSTPTIRSEFPRCSENSSRMN